MNNVKEYNVKLTRENIGRFCEIVNKFDSDFNVSSGRVSVDGKSILGLFALSFDTKIILTIVPRNEKLEDIEAAICEFLDN